MEKLTKTIELLNLIKAALALPKLPELPSHKNISAPSMTPSSAGAKIPGVSQGSKKDPVKVAQQLKAGQPPKAKIKEVLKTADNGQWSIDEEDEV